MNNRLFAGLGVGVVLLTVSGPLFGHHNSAARYDEKNPVSVTGTVTEFQMINPHIRLGFEVKGENGAVEKWAAEGGSPSGLYRRGWRTDDVKLGDQVTVTGAPAVDGSNVMEIKKIVTGSGKELK